MNSTFGKRLRTVIGVKKFTQQRVADATGLNRVTISLLMNDKVEIPQTGTIHKLAEFLECNPIWLETGVGEMFEPSEISSKENIPSTKRLAYLKGSMTLQAFSKRCGIDEATLTGYLEDGRIRNDQHVYQIAMAFNTSIGWLTAGEAWQSPDKKYTGFSKEKHSDLGFRLYEISQFMQKLVIDLRFSYPLIGKLSRPLKMAEKCLEGIDELRSLLEENHYEDNPAGFDTKTYYCGAKAREQELLDQNLNATLAEMEAKVVALEAENTKLKEARSLLMDAMDACKRLYEVLQGGPDSRSERSHSDAPASVQSALMTRPANKQVGE